MNFHENDFATQEFPQYVLNMNKSYRIVCRIGIVISAERHMFSDRDISYGDQLYRRMISGFLDICEDSTYMSLLINFSYHR